ncbi:hypothetical protein BAC2_02784 [uncultured bacterium]|nr:hypothetical protein BAC2_02784 [uncultured bacterium]
MLDDFRVEYDVEALAGLNNMLCEAVPIVEIKSSLRGMPASNLDVSRCGIDADDLCATLRQWFAQQTGATTDIEDFQSGESGFVSRVPTEMAGDPLHYVVATDRVEFVDLPEFSNRVPPFIGQRCEASDLVRINGLGLKPRSA